MPGWTRPRLAGIVALLITPGALGCGDSSESGPRLESIEPRLLSSDLATPIRIIGRELHAGITVVLDSQESSDIRDTWQVTVGEIALDDVERISSSELQATVPAGLSRGNHPVTVLDPYGQIVEPGLSIVVVPMSGDLVISIEDAPGGAGTAISDVSLDLGDRLTMFAVMYPPDGEAIDVAATWTVSGGIGSLSPRQGTSSTLLAENVGTGVVTASHPVAANGRTGTITAGAPTRCGDTMCDPGETPTNCPEDCAGMGSCTTCAGGLCGDTCDTSTCLLECPMSGCICDLDCATSNVCEVTCGAGTTCDVDCTRADDCIVECGPGSLCDIDCNGAGDCSDVTCPNGAACLLDCSNSAPCGFDSCDDGPTSCGGDILVCGRACP